MGIGIADDSERESNPMAVTCGLPGFVLAPDTKRQVNAGCDVSEGESPLTHMPAVAGELVLGSRS